MTPGPPGYGLQEAKMNRVFNFEHIIGQILFDLIYILRGYALLCVITIYDVIDTVSLSMTSQTFAVNLIRGGLRSESAF